MSKACFGSTMENLRRRANMRFVTTEAQVEIFLQRATLKNLKNFGEDPVSVSLNASSVFWN